MQRLRIKRASEPTGTRFISALLTYLPGAWVSPNDRELIALYRARYRMALEEGKYDAAMIFLDKILEVDPLNLDAKYLKGDLYHRHLRDYSGAIEQYNKVIRLSAGDRSSDVHTRARTSLTELMELLS